MFRKRCYVRKHFPRWLPFDRRSTADYEYTELPNHHVPYGITARRRGLLRIFLRFLLLSPYILILFVALAATLRPSYTHLPHHYQELRQRCIQSIIPGRANVNNEKVFIAASLYDPGGELTGGAWGESVLQLIDMLGPNNVFLSIYENDPDPLARASLGLMEGTGGYNSSLVAEYDVFASLTADARPLRRIAYLAELRNRALRPLDADLGMRFDKILFLNDISFNPIDAAQLLFSTNMDSKGRTQYRAACAVDFLNPFKFYDTFATRDLEGYSMGLPFFPWFTDAQRGDSRRDVLDQKDAVRVRSCWGGMVAFEAKWFQAAGNSKPQIPAGPNGTHLHTKDGRYTTPAEEQHAQLPPSPSHHPRQPLRFRAVSEPYWESSECCLIHADLQPPRNAPDGRAGTGIYLNPYVRVAYDHQTLRWLGLSRRPERLFSYIHNILNHLAHLPKANLRRTEEAGDAVVHREWSYDRPAADVANRTAGEESGEWKRVRRVAEPGGFCGVRGLMVMKEAGGEESRKWTWSDAPEG